jgi:hypothetical protein
MRQYDEDDYDDDLDQGFSKAHKIMFPKLNVNQSNMHKSDSMDHLNPWNAA